MNINKLSVGVLYVLFILFVPLADAFGASADYWDDNPLRLDAGTLQEVEIRLQNLAGSSEDILLRASIQEGKEFATLIDSDLDYRVPFGSENVPVKLLVEVPKDAEPGSVFEIIVSFDQLAASDDSFLQLARAVKKKIPVEVVKGDSVLDSSSSVLIIIVLVSVCLAVALLVYFRKRKHSNF